MFRLTVQSSLQRQLNTRAFSSGVRLFNASKATTHTTTTTTDLSWTDFFKLRRQQRRINLGSSIVTALIGSTASWGYLANVEIDPTQMIFGFDPFMIFFAGFMAATGVGYMFGPLLGSAVFRITAGKKINGFKSKNKEFLERVFRNRVDPSSQSFSNPVPDYYGEKIDSLKTYKQWLRDCHAYRRKANEFL
ncbi:CYFA0S01e03576g1_1 [Cyberlindnera fabianii]|uniref:Presequence translocated-associated motor subunit PAM17 n=1 Tax=Cyberlindnera fabianii TaxID=36022 RepID=A0A061AGI5_CYBFA|nr:CYFA0S01e03576g1_1 [Cyberlindnera fabianii]